jgi:HAD domain in Swiss Army Knife RNA repair proteins
VSRDDMAPVLFLDIDDVLCLNAPYGGFDAVEVIRGRHPKPTQVYLQLFSPAACSVLRRVHEAMGGHLRYVISSTWRELLSREDLSLLFCRGGLDFVASALHEADRWCTPLKVHRGQRVDEIAAWLDRHHRGEPFAIIDDGYSGASLRPALLLRDHPLHGRVVLCQENVGLCDAHVQTLLDALARPASLPNLEANP